jgi:hypothetical protein
LLFVCSKAFKRKVKTVFSWAKRRFVNLISWDLNGCRVAFLNFKLNNYFYALIIASEIYTFESPLISLN